MSEVLVYGDQDLNLIDGSSVWLASTVEVLAHAPGVRVRVLTHAPIGRTLLIEELLRRSDVSFVDPWSSLAGGRRAWRRALRRSPPERLTPDVAAELLTLLDGQRPADLFLVRSPEVSQRMARDPDLADRLWAYVCAPGAGSDLAPDLEDVLARCRLALCQTEELRSLLLERDAPASDVEVFPPMVRDWQGEPPRLVPGRPPRLCYSGKFSPDYFLDEQLDAFRRIRSACDAELHVFGDKFHAGAARAGYAERLARRLRSTPGVHWHGGLPRHEVNARLARCQVASSWRSPRLDGSLELSTKILEYANVGLPVLLNPTAIQQRVFGSDYPYFVRSEADFVAAFRTLTTSAERHAEASDHVRRVAQAYTFSRASERVARLIRERARAPAAGPRLRIARGEARPGRRVLLAGHDLRFASPLEEYFSRPGWDGPSFDRWRGHDEHDPDRSREALRRADVIWCEWCLGNAIWYSHHKRPGQRLIVRLHHQEMDLPHPERVRWEAVDRLVVIAPQHHDELRRRLPDLGDRLRLIPNLVDCDALRSEKLAYADFGIGLLGFVPRRKRPDLALEIFEKLRARDSRWSLHLKGRPPWEYDWCWRRPEERRYYEALYARLARTGGVTVDAYSRDVRSWLAKLGFLVSSSDHEGSHQAVAEAMAAGTIPVVRDWPGARRLYPERHVFCGSDEAVALIEGFHRPEEYEKARSECAAFARQYFDKAVIFERLDRLFAELA